MNFFLCLRFKCYPPFEICVRRVWTKFLLWLCRWSCNIVQWNKYKLRFCVWKNSLFLLIGVSSVERGQMWLTIEPKKDEWLPYLINWKSIIVRLISTRVGRTIVSKSLQFTSLPELYLWWIAIIFLLSQSNYIFSSEFNLHSKQFQ